MLTEVAEVRSERQAVPRVTHLGYFDAAIYGVRAGVTFDQLRLQLARVGQDLRRYEGRLTAPQRTSPHHFWHTTRETLLGLMQSGFVASQPLPSSKHTVANHAGKKYSLSEDGRALAHASVGDQRERFAVALSRTYPAFRRYLDYVVNRPLMVPEFTERDLVSMGVTEDKWGALAREVADRESESVGARIDIDSCAESLAAFTRKRFRGRQTYERKELLDAVNYAVGGFIAHEAKIMIDATSLGVIHEWSRQLFLIGSSRYVHGMPGGLLQWSACQRDHARDLKLQRRVVPDAIPEVIEAIANAYKAVRREETAMVEYYAVRATAAFAARVANDLIDKVVVAMVTGAISNTLAVQPSAGAQRSLPPSELPLRIGGRRYSLISMTNKEA